MVEFAFAMVLVLLLAFAAIDFGRIAYFSIEASNAARAAAQYGIQNATTMMLSAGIQTAAEKEAPDIALPSSSCGTKSQALGTACWNGVAQTPFSNAAPYYGCECPDGSSLIPGATSCGPCSTANFVYYVQVNTQVSYMPFFSWFGLFTASGQPVTVNSIGKAKIRLGAQ